MAVVLLINAAMSVVGGLLTFHLLPKFKETFIKAQLYGVDMSKRYKEKIPESMGAIVGCVFLMVMFVYMPVPFGQHLRLQTSFPHDEFVEMVAALLSICCMLLLGFADDVLDLRWRHKLLLPTFASLPLLVVYYVNFNSTIVIMPKPLRSLFGYDLDLGFLYYVYMGMLAVFCTNAINILAGINGLEVGQSIIIAASMAVFNLVELFLGTGLKAYQFSLYFLLPYLATTLPLLYYNWYPSQMFVGDTFCYFSGMLFAVVGILGHFSKTMLLFFIPQVLNFLYSVPQVFRLVPCPRHRLPRYDAKSDTMQISYSQFKPSELRPVGGLFLRVARFLRLVDYEESGHGEDSDMARCNNLTLINFAIRITGPIHEKRLTVLLLLFQVFCSAIAFTIRYPMVRVFYDVPTN